MHRWYAKKYSTYCSSPQNLLQIFHQLHFSAKQVESGEYQTFLQLSSTDISTYWWEYFWPKVFAETGEMHKEDY